MSDYMLPIVVVMGIVIAYLITKNRKTAKENRTREMAAWVVTENSSTYRDNKELHEYVAKAQTHLCEEYRITGENEWRLTKEILSAFRKYLNEKLLSDRLSAPQTKYAVTDEDFFMLNLCAYLEDHQCDYSFLGHDMHEETISRKEYGSYGGRLYDATYSLTQFAVVFHKLYYISYCYCKNSKALSTMDYRFDDEEEIAKIIATKRISVSRM